MRLAIVRLARHELTIVGSANGMSGRLPGCEEAARTMRTSEIMKRCRVPCRWAQTVQEVEAEKYDGIPGVPSASKPR